MIMLQGFKLLPCDGVEASHSPYRLIPTLPIAVELVGGISQSVWRRGQFPTFLQHRQLSTNKESRMWFNPTLLHTEALQKIIRSNRNRLEIEMSELLLDIMVAMDVDSVSFCLNDLVVLLVHSQVKAEKHQVRKVVQECWKLTPAPNGLTYTTYQGNYNRSCHYEPIKRVGRFYTVTREQLESL